MASKRCEDRILGSRSRPGGLFNRLHMQIGGPAAAKLVARRIQSHEDTDRGLQSRNWRENCKTCAARRGATLVGQNAGSDSPPSSHRTNRRGIAACGACPASPPSKASWEGWDPFQGSHHNKKGKRDVVCYWITRDGRNGRQSSLRPSTTISASLRPLHEDLRSRVLAPKEVDERNRPRCFASVKESREGCIACEAFVAHVQQEGIQLRAHCLA